MKKALTILLAMASIHTFAEPPQPKTTPVIVFDFGGVLGGTDRKMFNEELQVCLGLSQKEADDLIDQYKGARASGQTAKQFWDTYSQRTGTELAPDWLAYLEKVRLLALTSDPGMQRLVGELHRRGYRIALLANMSAHRAEAIRKRGIFKPFDLVLLSSELGCKKPDKKIFHALLSRVNVPPSSCIFIDDKQKNVDAALSLGIDAICFCSEKQLREELAQRGIL